MSQGRNHRSLRLNEAFKSFNGSLPLENDKGLQKKWHPLGNDKGLPNLGVNAACTNNFDRGRDSYLCILVSPSVEIGRFQSFGAQNKYVDEKVHLFNCISKHVGWEATTLPIALILNVDWKPKCKKAQDGRDIDPVPMRMFQFESQHRTEYHVWKLNRWPRLSGKPFHFEEFTTRNGHKAQATPSPRFALAELHRRVQAQTTNACVCNVM